jgi:hypothetical protein
MGARFKLILKWAVFLFVISVVIQVITLFLVGLFSSIINTGLDQSWITLIGIFLASLLTLPFVYWTALKAALEAYRKKVLGPKQKGLNIAIGVIVFALLMEVILGYLLTKQIDFRIGVLPILLAFVAGQRADSVYRKK